MSELYPLLFKPVLKDYIWGGRNLETLLGRTLPEGIIAESWEIAGHSDGTSLVANGPYAGMPLTELHERLGLDLIGRNSLWAQRRSKFPLLVKILDAQQRLSVQVHPDDNFAGAHEGDELGKSEMWLVLHAEPGAELILGVTRGTTKRSFKKAIEDNSLGSHLHHIRIRVGDFICLPSGTLHAILGGSFLAEIQQNSNVTYRVYDWGRANKNRPLHIEKALQVINFDQVEPVLPKGKNLPSSGNIHREGLCSNQYFNVERLQMPTGARYRGALNGDTFEIWGVTKGATTVRGGSSSCVMSAVQFVLLPAAIGEFTIEANRPSSLLRTFVQSTGQDQDDSGPDAHP